MGPDRKARPLPDVTRETGGLDRAGGHVLNAPAGVTHQVVMVIPVVVGQLVPGRSLSQFNPVDDLQALEEAQRPVDRRQVDARVA